MLIETLEAWGVFQHPCVSDEFRKLRVLRNKAIHFNPTIVSDLRAEALAALQHLSKIISSQFGFFGGQKWMLSNTPGAAFIKAEAETDPFIKSYYIPQCPRVGPYYAIRFINHGTMFFDRSDYEDREISNSDFAELYNTRTADMLVIPEAGIEIENIVGLTRGVLPEADAEMYGTAKMVEAIRAKLVGSSSN